MRVGNGWLTKSSALLNARFHLLLAIALLIGGRLPAGAQVVNPANGHYYEAVSVPTGINWFQARDAAAVRTYLGRKGHLVTITSAAEEQFVVANLPSAVTGNYLLGGHQDPAAPGYSEPGGGWQWVTGEPWNYTFWKPFQPDNGSNTENALMFFSPEGGWNDVNDTSALTGYVVEYEFVPQVFDVNGDGRSDLVFQNSATGQVVFWFMNGTSVTGGASLAQIPAHDYKVVGTGDFNQDGSPDLVFQNNTTGQIVIWFMNQTRFIGGASASLIPLQGYKVVGVGDVNRDGLPDLVLQNTTTNRVVIWFMNGTTVTGGSSISLTPANGYQVVGVYDMNTDGSPDLVLQDSQTGKIVIWYMNGITVTDGVSLPTPAPNYKVVGVSAFNLSLSGLVLQNSITNQAVFWYLDGGNVIGGGFASGLPDSNYKIVGPR